MLDFTTTAHGWDVPGGPYYTDVTEFVEAATNQLAPGELLMMDNFTLAESMSAIEIMDPRLDSGLAQSLDEKPTASFDPYCPLLPEEVCWILDRAFAAEMTWHQGRALSQTVYTLLYVHELPALDPLAWYSRQPKALPIDRPGNLVTSVLNAFALGLLKSCDLVWREFTQKHVYENEDVMTEKSEISLCEGMSVARVVDSLESAEQWLANQGGLPWSEELLLRVQLRKESVVMVRIFASRPRADSELNRQFLSMSRELVQRIQDRKQPSLPPLGSQARAAFDPAICRKFISHVPLPVIRLFDQERTWDALQAMFQGLQDLSHLEKTEDLRAWKTTLNLASRDPPSFKRCSYVRSRTTSSFTSASALIFNTYPVSWLVREILFEVGGIPKEVIESLYSGADRVTLFHWHAFENPAAEALYTYFSGLSNNRPRQRRTFSKSLRRWRDLFEISLGLDEHLQQYPEPHALARRIPLVVSHLRLAQIIEIIFSGFEIDLYLPNEMPFLYWYLLQSVLPHANNVLCDLSEMMKENGTNDRDPGETVHVAEDSASDYVTGQIEFNWALTNMCRATLLGMCNAGAYAQGCGPVSSNLRRVLKRRLEWAFPSEDESDDLMFADMPPPRFSDFEIKIASLREIDEDTAVGEQRESWKRARDALECLQVHPEFTYSHTCQPAFHKFIDSLMGVCMKKLGKLDEGLCYTPSASHDSALHPWFNT